MPLDKTISVQTSPICPGTSTNIIVENSEVGVNYQLRNNSGNASIGSAVAGTGGNINLPTGNLAASTTFNVLATDAVSGLGCNKQMPGTVTVNLKTTSTDPTSISGVLAVAPGVSTTLSLVGGSLGTGASWRWYAGGCGSGASIGSGTSIVVSPSSATTYFVRAEGDCNNSNCASATVNISQPTCGNTYVSSTGSDINNGSSDYPFATLAKALTALNGDNKVIMATGTYTSNTSINIPANIVIEGGFDATTGWKKSSTGVTTLNFTGEESVPGNVIAHKIGFKATSNGWTLQDLTINTDNATGRTSLDYGKSNYAVWINGSQNYNILRCNITSGNASGGYGRADAPAQFNGSSPASPTTATSGTASANNTNQLGRAGGAGSTGGAAGVNASRVLTAQPTAGGGGGGGGAGAGSGGGGSNCSGGSPDNSGAGGGGGAAAGNTAAGLGGVGAANDAASNFGLAGSGATNGSNGNGGISNGGNGGAGAGVGAGAGGTVAENTAPVVGGPGIAATQNGAGGGGGAGSSHGCAAAQTGAGGAGFAGNAGTNGTATSGSFADFYTPGFGTDGTSGRGGGGGGGGGGQGQISTGGYGGGGVGVGAVYESYGIYAGAGAVNTGGGGGSGYSRGATGGSGYVALRYRL
jgi:hypothetical protein